jgi:hypothetical protein
MVEMLEVRAEDRGTRRGFSGVVRGCRSKQEGISMSWLTDVWDYLRRRPKPTPTPKPPINPPPPLPPIEDYVSALLSLHNRERNSRGLSSLQLHQSLNSSAQQEASACANIGRLDHNANGITPSQRMMGYGYVPSVDGENIAAGYTDSQSVMRGWYYDLPHRENILGPYVHVGFGMAVGRDGRIYWTADYASPLGRIVVPLAIPYPDGISPNDIVD